MRVHPLLTASVALCCAVTALTACGVPAGPDSLEDITDEVPARISDTTTPSTTTTTLPPTDPTDSTALATTTTIEPVAALESVRLFFVSGDQLVEIVVQDEPPFEANLLRSLLEQGPTSEARDTFVTAGLIRSADRSGGTVTIDLSQRLYNTLGSNRRYQAIAQIVLTYLNNLDAVGTATFTLDGDSLAYPGPNGFLVTRPVSIDDYANLLVDIGTPVPVEVPPTSSTSTTTTSSTTSTTTPATTTQESTVAEPTVPATTTG